MPDDHQFASRHLVEGQRAGLVGADRRRGTERLDRSQPLDDRTLGRKRLRSQGEHGRHNRGEARRDSSDREADPDQEQVVEVVAVQEAEDHDQRQRNTRHDRDQHRQLIELPGERGLLLLNTAQHPGDLSDLGGHARRSDDHLAAPPCDGRVHVRHVDPIAERDLVPGDRLDGLQDRSAFSGERGLFDLQRRRDEQPPVGGNLVARLERDHITGNELLRGNVGQLAATSNVCANHEHLLERGDTLRRLPLLIQAQHRVEDGQADDHHTGRELLERDHADHSSTEQDELHQVAVLT
jgi:hypothetical protein